MLEVYTTQEAADILKVSEKNVRVYIAQGRLKAISLTGKSGSKRGPRSLRIPKKYLEEFMEENMI